MKRCPLREKDHHRETYCITTYQAVPKHDLASAAAKLPVYALVFRLWVPGNRKIRVLQGRLDGDQAHRPLPPVQSWRL